MVNGPAHFEQTEEPTRPMNGPDLTRSIQRLTAEYETEALDFLKALVNGNSFTGNPGGLRETGERIMAKGREHGLVFEKKHIDDDPGKPFHLAHAPPGRKPDFYGIVGHFDTVHPPDSPFSAVREVDDRLYGPGIQDMKGGIAAALFSCVVLGRLLGREGVPVRIVFNCDEETGSRDSRPLIESELSGAAGAFVFEGHYAAHPAVVTSRKGIVMGKIATRGRSAHAGEAPQEGANAIVEMAHKVALLDRLNDLPAGKVATTGKIQGGIAANQIPALCEAELDFRFNTPEDEESLRREATRILEKQFVSGVATEFELQTVRPPFVRTPVSERLRDRYLAAAARFGRTLGEASVGGGSDGNLTAALGVPTLDGLGCAGDGPHTDQEYIRQASLLESIQHFSLFFYQLATQNRRTA